MSLLLPLMRIDVAPSIFNIFKSQKCFEKLVLCFVDDFIEFNVTDIFRILKLRSMCEISFKIAF